MPDYKGKILIVEDEPAIAQDMCDILEMNGYHVTGTAYSYDKAIEALAADTPDLVFLDIALKGNGSGLDVARVLNDRYDIPFIFLTSFSDQETIKEVVSLNPYGYLVKPFKEKDIPPAVALAFSKAAMSRKEIFPSIDQINGEIPKPLSPQEYNVLKLIWKGNKNQEIADLLFVSVNTIKTHVVKIYSKLQVNSRASAINRVWSIYG